MEFLALANANNFAIMSKPTTPFRQKQKFIERIVKKENLNWAREMKIANALWKKYPDGAFWADFLLPFQLNSLAWLLGEGAEELTRQWNFFQLDNKRKRATIDKPTYSDLPLFKYEEATKPKSMKDWMNLNKTSTT